MNDYQKEHAEKSAQLLKELKPIATVLGWDIRPNANTDPDFAPLAFYMTDGAGHEISARVTWNKKDRFEFSASEWPTHTDTEGRTQHVRPHDLGSEWQGTDFVPRETVPTTTAARSRSPDAIAKQIKSRLIPDYMRLYAVLAETAASRQKYATSEFEQIQRLFEATQETRHELGDKPRFIRNLPGGTLSVDYRSSGSVRIDLGTDEMIAVIGFLREHRSNTT